MGKASRRHRPGRSKPGAPKRQAETGRDGGSSLQAQADAALARLARLNSPGKVSLAGAYALGYGALALAQIEEDGPDWFSDLDPLETLFLGTVWPQQFPDGYEFANACTAWLRLLRGTVHWAGIECFVREAVTASQEHDLPVDDGQLMYLLAARLEPAGLNQRTLARDLLPDRSLARERFARGPDAEGCLPGPPADVATRIARFWESTEVGLPNDGTPADALREGLHMFAAAGLDARADPVVLLPALYAALVAAESEELAQAGERATAWALGLAPGSPLIPVTDILLVAADRSLDAETTLGHLMALPEFTQQVSEEDRIWHSSPGDTVTTIAFELGYERISRRDVDVIHMNVSAKAAFQAQLRAFEEKFGRPPEPSDPVFFDPDADEPVVMSPAGAEQAGVASLEAAGINPAWIYAYQHTGGLLPRFDGTFDTDADQVEWQEHIDRYMQLHKPDSRLDHAAETSKLQAFLVATSLSTASRDPQHAASLITRLSREPDPDDGETLMMHQYLDAWRDSLADSLASHPGVMDAAREYGRAWAGADLSAQVRAAESQPAAELAYPVLLAIAVASIAPR